MLEAAIAGARAIEGAGRGLIQFKADGTPHAAADMASDSAIRRSLAASPPAAGLSALPIVSEEGARDLPADLADHRFLLVDPLDGTREFMDGHPDHAVCIALVEDRRPVAGVILAPHRRLAWLAGDRAEEIALDPDLRPLPGRPRCLTLDPEVCAPRRLAASRSRPDPMARRIFPEIGDLDVLSIGAVLKLVAIARGEACVFPTRNPSSEWDIAAGEALLRAAGGDMVGLDGQPLVYGRAALRFLHEPYVAARSPAVAALALARWTALDGPQTR